MGAGLTDREVFQRLGNVPALYELEILYRRFNAPVMKAIMSVGTNAYAVAAIDELTPFQPLIVQLFIPFRASGAEAFSIGAAMNTSTQIQQTEVICRMVYGNWFATARLRPADAAIRKDCGGSLMPSWIAGSTRPAVTLQEVNRAAAGRPSDTTVAFERSGL